MLTQPAHLATRSGPTGEKAVGQAGEGYEQCGDDGGRRPVGWRAANGPFFSNYQPKAVATVENPKSRRHQRKIA
ncbi:MAG: hypothetical protein JNM56_15640 [Planctomycetia bacterium]|nr:hypothetical protein [Planctomycetia bacterium]